MNLIEVVKELNAMDKTDKNPAIVMQDEDGDYIHIESTYYDPSTNLIILNYVEIDPDRSGLDYPEDEEEGDVHPMAAISDEMEEAQEHSGFSFPDKRLLAAERDETS